MMFYEQAVLVTWL